MTRDHRSLLEEGRPNRREVVEVDPIQEAARTRLHICIHIHAYVYIDTYVCLSNDEVNREGVRGLSMKESSS